VFSTHLGKKNFQGENFLSGKSKKLFFWGASSSVVCSMQLFTISISKTTHVYKGHTDIVASVIKDIHKTQDT